MANHITQRNLHGCGNHIAPALGLSIDDDHAADLSAERDAVRDLLGILSGPPSDDDVAFMEAWRSTPKETPDDS